MDGRLAKRKSAVNKFCNTEKKIHDNMKSLNNQNKMLFKLSKKTITHRDLNKISKINKSSYYFSSSNDRIVYSDLESRDSFIEFISD